MYPLLPPPCRVRGAVLTADLFVWQWGRREPVFGCNFGPEGQTCCPNLSGFHSKPPARVAVEARRGPKQAFKKPLQALILSKTKTLLLSSCPPVLLSSCPPLFAQVSPGLLYGNASLPMQGIVFDGVRFQDPPADGAFGKDYFFCKGVRHQTLHPPPSSLSPLLSRRFKLSRIVYFIFLSIVVPCWPPSRRAHAEPSANGGGWRDADRTSALNGSKPHYLQVGSGVAMGDTWPVPPCFKDMTTRP